MEAAVKMHLKLVKKHRGHKQTESIRIRLITMIEHEILQEHWYAGKEATQQQPELAEEFAADMTV